MIDDDSGGPKVWKAIFWLAETNELYLPLFDVSCDFQGQYGECKPLVSNIASTF